MLGLDRSPLRAVRLVAYRVVLPGLVLLGLFVASEKMARPLYGNSPGIDLAARIWIALMYCGNFYIFSDYRRYERWLYGTRDPDADRDLATRVWNWFMSLLAFVLSMLFTLLTVRTFLPGLGAYAIPLAASIGLIYALPILLLPRE